MKNMRSENRQGGFVHLDILLVALALLAVIGFVGYRVMSTRMSSSSSSAAANTSNEALKQNDQEVQSSLKAVSQSEASADAKEQSPNLVQP